jgi:hypothetical protein
LNATDHTRTSRHASSRQHGPPFCSATHRSLQLFALRLIMPREIATQDEVPSLETSSHSRASSHLVQAPRLHSDSSIATPIRVGDRPAAGHKGCAPQGESSRLSRTLQLAPEPTGPVKRSIETNNLRHLRMRSMRCEVWTRRMVSPAEMPVPARVDSPQNDDFPHPKTNGPASPPDTG